MWIRRWVKVAAVALLCAGAAGTGQAQELAIQSFNGTGKMSFNRVPTATVYRVEWAPTPAGPWTNFNAAAQRLDAIEQFGTGSYTCSVPMCYRVVALVTNAPPAVPLPSGMVLIPAGTNSGTDPDFGAYSLTVAEFYMDATEVTKAQWDAVYSWAIANGYAFTNAGSGKAENHPVHTVSWYDCVTWCNARSQKEGRTPCYNLDDWSCNFAANGYRLPTHTEREYAARGGDSGRRFPWGDIIDYTLANYKGNPVSSGGYAYDTGYAGYDTRYATGDYPYTSPAGAFAANGYGLYDMVGNVAEWCNDSFDSARLTLGGSWLYDAYNALYRTGGWYGSMTAKYWLGFRTVCR